MTPLHVGEFYNCCAVVTKNSSTFNRFICEYDQFGPIIVVMIVTVDPGDSRGTVFFVEKLLISKVFCNLVKKLQLIPEWAWTL